MMAQVEERDGYKVLEGEETRVIMFGFGHEHDTLLYSTDVTDANPFQDVRVRQAAAHAIDIDAIDRVLFRGKIEAASQLVPAGIWAIPKPIRIVQLMTQTAPARFWRKQATQMVSPSD